MDKRECFHAISTLGVGGFLEAYKPALIKELKSVKSRVVWIHGAGCTGCDRSFLNGDTEILSTLLCGERIIYHKTLLEKNGIFVDGVLVRHSEINIEYYHGDIDKSGGYILVVEGALVEGPKGSGKYCLVGGKPVREKILDAANKAKVILSLGTCASCGGVPSDRRSENVVRDFPGLIFRGVVNRRIILEEYGIKKPVINLPGCPPKSEHILALLVLLLLDKIQFPGDSNLLDEYLRFKIIKEG